MERALISICMIVKNEEACLEACLNAFASYGYEIVIADTGSTDRTKEIAANYTKHIYDYTWTNDFSAARNFIMEKATNEFVLMIDADEVVTNFEQKEVEQLLQLHRTDIGRLIRNNEYERNGQKYRYQERVNRLFSKECYYYEGSIHEQLVPKEGIQMGTYLIPIEMSHSGYEGNLEVRRKKTKRNIELLLLSREKHPDDPYLIYQLGKSYYMQEDYQQAAEYFREALSYDLNITLEYVIDLVESFGYALLNTEQYEEALLLEAVYGDFAYTADFVFLMGLIYLNNAKFTEAIREFKKATTMKLSKMEGCNSFLAYYNLGVIYECLGETKKAMESYQASGNFEAAKQGVRRLSTA